VKKTARKAIKKTPLDTPKSSSTGDMLDYWKKWEDMALGSLKCEPSVDFELDSAIAAEKVGENLDRIE